MHSTVFPVGEYLDRFNDVIGADLPKGLIYQSSGLITHIKKRHPNLLKYVSNIPDIIISPDYIGVNPKEPESIELIRRYEKNILVAIKLDKKDNYLYVASLYDISEAKITKRLEAGRIKKIIDK